MDKKIKSPKDLNAVRDKAKASIDLRTGGKDMRIVVHMGTCGIAAGARDVLAQVIDELQRASVDNVTINLSGCLGLCDQEPMFTLTDKSGREYCYAKLDKGKVHTIIQQHVLSNQPVADFIVNAQARKEI